MREIRRCLSEFDFSELFTQHLLWDGFRAKHALEIAGHFYEVEGVAEKRGVAAFLCQPAKGEPFPGSAERKRIGREIEKLHHEYLIIFIDREHTKQVWAVPRRDDGKTKTTSEVTYYAGKGVEFLAQRINKLSFTLDESEATNLVEVSARVNQALLAERVTKKFFKEFNEHRKAFVKFLVWIEDESKRDWYCSVLLNRLMFIYFLGGKGFLPGGTSFLSFNLAANINENGQDTFYTHFLLPLSFFGLGERKTKRGRFEDTFKDVLYLDGGLFTVHQVERELGLNKETVERGEFPAGARIPDAEFRRWFDYFDKWRWTLDEDRVENDGYISPHILGYIFEKYINQKQMGAYYTKEDITGYICRNTIVPRLLDMLAESGDKGAQAVRPLPIGPHPNLLNEGRGISDGEGIDRYVYGSVKQDEKLPTETDYEQDQRRQRYEGILADFDAGKIDGIDDFITYNLDIERLALDFVSNIQDPDVLHDFYFKGLQRITVLDPTCGSGAFLFAALLILYPLYNASLSRMRYLVGKATGAEPTVQSWDGSLGFTDLETGQAVFGETVPAFPHGTDVLDKMRAEVERINDHPSAEYFIKKSIIVNNLFGVDIMEEAVEICKLRLFLTLIATVERVDAKDNFGVEPLPDIDFNILAGNALVGYTSIGEIDRLWEMASSSEQQARVGGPVRQQTMDRILGRHERIENVVREYGQLLHAWRLQQLGEWKGAPVTKDQVLRAADSVRPDLDEDLWQLYKTAGLAQKTVRQRSGKPRTVELTQAEFKRTHQPFHWLLEYPAIEAEGGFDVIVGNPPYVELKDVSEYKVFGFDTLPCGDLYALVAERAFQQVRPRGALSLIVPVSMFNTDGFRPLQDVALRQSRNMWVSTYSNRPSQLFDGAQKRLTVFVSKSRGPQDRQRTGVYTTRYLRWTKAERESLIASRPEYCDRTDHRFLVLPSSLEKLGTALELGAFMKLASREGSLGDAVVDDSTFRVYYTRKFSYFLAFLDFVPLITRISDGATVDPSELKSLAFPTRETQLCAVAALSSTTFFWFWNVLSDVRNVNKRDLLAFPFNPLDLGAGTGRALAGMADQYLTALRDTATLMTKSGLRIQSFDHSAQKGRIDAIDEILAEHFGLNDQELSAIQNYDLKYRLGSREDDGEED